jgi:hypothetical protein
MESKKIFILLPNQMYTGDGIRSTLGLAVENHYGYAVIMNGAFPRFSEYVKENIDWVRDMEGEVFTVGADSPEEAALAPLTLEELGEQMREADHIIPYGLPKPTRTPPPACAEE